MATTYQSRLEDLHQQQLRDPGNVILAHDIGLAHLWQARKRHGEAGSVANWLRVIGNLAIVLASESYWQDWCAERSTTYGKSITDAHITAARLKVTEWLLAELASATEADPSGEAAHLEALFRLESKGIRLLKQNNQPSAVSGVKVELCCGPILANQAGLSDNIRKLFQGMPHLVPDKGESLRIILTAVHTAVPENGEEIQAAAEGARPLLLTFSQLGLPAIYLEQKNPQRSLDVLTTLHCERCASKHAPAQVENLPTWHQADCPDFIRHNLSYAALAQGADLYRRHALELTISAYLLLAYQSLVVKPANTALLQANLRHALSAGRELALVEALPNELSNLVLGWAEGLVNDQRLDDAISLLEATQDDFSQNGVWQGRLASLLNMRGVQHANEKRWAESTADLRRAYALNPFNPQIRENLENALRYFADAMYTAGEAQLARNLLNEAVHLGEAAAVQPEKAPPTAERTVEQAVIPEAVFKYKELAHPVLFDRHGRLQLTAFETSGQATLSQAKSEAATAGIDLIDVFVLLLALLQSPGNELSRLLKLQGVTPESLQDRIQAVVVANSTASHRLQEVAILSQFDFWSSAIEVLNMAWEVAQYDQGQIGETHLVYGLLLSPGVSRLLAQAGLDVNQMVTQVAWH